MANNRWHLLSTFETEDSLDMFCRKAGFIRDKDEKYLYVLKDGVEREVVTELNRILVNDYTVGRESDKNDVDWHETTRYKYSKDYLVRFLYVENKSRLSRYQRAQEIIDFSDKEYADWKKQ